MITISKIVLNNIKRFKGKHEFKFGDKNLFTISGKNGSGKTTLIESMMICQMAYFINDNREMLENSEIMNKAIKKIFSFLTNTNSSIELFMFDNETQKQISFTVKIEYNFDQYYSWKLGITDEDNKIFSKYWNLYNPSCLFFFIDSDKYFEEKSITYDSIKIKKNDDPYGFLLEYLVDYKNVEKFAYQKLINDWILQRLVPPDINYQMSFLIGRILFSYLLPQLKIQHFTGATGNEFSIMAKNVIENSPEFDYRYLSAGEKCIFYLCILINYFSNIGLLIIDEPENHLHEDLLLKLSDLLHQITICNDYPSFIIEKNIYKSKSKRKEDRSKFDTDLEKVFKNYKLQKVIFTTHSKSLIYKNFEFGENYVVDSDFKLLNQTSAEVELRKLGISTIYEKLLFVEGNSDKTVAEKLLSDIDVTIVELNGCEKIIQMYRDLRLLKEKLSNMKICFLMDRDTRDGQIDIIEAEDSEFFKEHFIVLERHELENYYLDEKLWEDTLDIDNPTGLPISIKKEDIHGLLFSTANNTKVTVYQKELNEKLRMQINNLTKILGKASNISCSTEEDFKDYIDSAISKISLENLKDEFMNTYHHAMHKYANWNEDILKYCDGKDALRYFKHKLATELKVFPERIDLYMDKLVLDDRECKYEISKLFHRVKKLLN